MPKNSKKKGLIEFTIGNTVEAMLGIAIQGSVGNLVVYKDVKKKRSR